MKMDDDQLLEILRRQEDAASAYVHGQLGREREDAMRQYHRLPYGNEVDGESDIVTSDIQDSVEWILPALLKTFTATDKAVSFEPMRAEDAKGSEQATDACNYVFYKQNNGFLVLYTAIKDMLTVRNCAVMWRKETQETVSSVPFKGATEEMLAMMLSEDDAEIESATPQEVMTAEGIPVTVYNGRLKKTEEKTIVKVEAFSPDTLLVSKDWTSPLLQDCPYVARMMRVTLSDLKLMGFDVDPSDLKASDNLDYNPGSRTKLSDVDRIDQTIEDVFLAESDDDSMAEGWLRIEFALVDRDGDGIAERLCVYRLSDKILKAEVVSHVPIATSSPILNPHRWDGMSIADAVADLQKLHTELIRESLNNLHLTNRPRTKVLTDANWNPLVNIDDLLDSRAGGVIRQRDVNAVTEQVIPFAAAASMPMLEYVQGMRENRTGVSRTSMGMNPDSLNSTATGRQIDQSAAMQRIELIARIIAETLVKPIFQGILKTLTEGGMEKMVFRLRNEFVEYDPNEWRDWYDMTINVGLGTGDTSVKAQQLMAVYQMQQAGLQMNITTPKHIYNTMAKLVENAGFKDVQNFVQDPAENPQPPQVPMQIQIEQAKAQTDAQKFQMQLQADIQKFQAEAAMQMQIETAKLDAKMNEIQANLELQASNDIRDGEREKLKAEFDAQIEKQKLEFDAWKAELDARVKLRVASINHGNSLDGEGLEGLESDRPAPIDQLVSMHQQTLGMIAELAKSINAPKMIVRDQSGKALGIQPVGA